MEFIIILFLLILNGIFAMYEIALVSSSKARLETLVSKGNKSAKGVLKQLEEPEKFLSTIQIGITLIGIISGAYGGVAIADDVTPLFAMIPGLELYAKDLAMVTTVAVITYLSLIIGELVPKSMALNNPERYATLLSPFMIILTKVSYPFVCLLSASTKLTNKLIGMKDGEERQMTQEELKMILHQSSEQGVIDGQTCQRPDDAPPRCNRVAPLRHARRSASDYPGRALQQISVGGKRQGRNHRCCFCKRYHPDVGW